MDEFRRTDREIVEMVRKVLAGDQPGKATVATDLAARLPASLAKEFVPSGMISEWHKIHAPAGRNSVVSEIREYIPFAKEVAQRQEPGCFFMRGPLGISLSHLSAWVWLAGDDLDEMTNGATNPLDYIERIERFYKESQ